MAIRKAERDALRMKFGGKCAYCGCELPEKGWQADHVKPIHRYVRARNDWVNGEHKRIVDEVIIERPENDTPDNLVPSCASCNNYKHAMELESFRSQIGRQIEMLRAYSANFRTAERYGFLTVVEKPVVFWFEQYAAKEDK